MAHTQATRPQQGSGSILGGVAVAVALNTIPAWLTWLVLESPTRGTLLRSDLDTWLTVVTAALTATVLGIVVSLRSSKRFTVGLVLGVPLAFVAVMVFLYVELVTSGGSITG